MRQVSYTLPLEDDIVKMLPAGTYRVTLTGLSDSGDTVSVEARNSADNGWDAAVTFTKTDSGKIGSKTVTVNANGKLRARITGETMPTSVKVRISA